MNAVVRRAFEHRADAGDVQAANAIKASIERYALPKSAVVMAPNATNDDRDSYLESAEGLENWQVTVWPSGASLMDFAGSSRGVDPFTSFIQHQEKTILMLATGGTLGSMAESGAGTLAGNAQQDVWEQIVARDAGIIAQAVMRSLLRPYLAAEFPGRPVAVDFFFDLSAKPTPKEIFETAARNAGYLVAQDVLEAETGWKLEKAPEQPTPAPGFAMNRREGRALSRPEQRPTPGTPLQTREKPLQNSPRVPDEQRRPPGRKRAHRGSGGHVCEIAGRSRRRGVGGGRSHAEARSGGECRGSGERNHQPLPEVPSADVGGRHLQFRRRHGKGFS